MNMTAVEWLYAEIDSKDNGEVPLWLYNTIEQSQHMDKEQRIRDMHSMQVIDGIDFFGDVTFRFSPEEYYEKTYGEQKI